MELNKVLICAPIGGLKQYSINTWFKWISLQDYENFDVAVCTNGKGSKELTDLCNQVEINNKKLIVMELSNSDDLSTIKKITHAREKLRRYAVEHGYDYLFFLDTDTIPAHRNIIQRLINWNKSVVSGLYFYKSSKVTVAIDKDTNTNVTIDKCDEAVKRRELIEVWGFGFGCLLLSREVFSSVIFDYDLFGENFTDDFGYCHALEQKGIKRWLDPYVICKHLEDPDKDKVANFTKTTLPFLTGIRAK